MNIFTMVMVISVLSFSTLALTEAEEFELYKEFKLKKQQEEQAKKNTATSDSNAKPVNIVINNNATTNGTNQNSSTANAYYYYEDKKKNQFFGVGLAYLLPTAGHFYADDWGRGLPFLLAQVGGAVFMVNAIEKECHTSYYDDYYYSNNYCEDKIDVEQYNLGLAVMVIAKIWEMFDANDAVKDYNRKLKRGLNLQVGLNSKKALIAGASYRF